MTAVAYREQHGLPATIPLVGQAVQAALSAGWERNRAVHEAALDRSRDPQKATAASTRRRTWAPATVAQRQADASARRVDLTDDQVERLGDPTDIAGWAERARRLIEQEDVTMAAIARATGLATATVSQRLRRYPAR